MNKNNAAGTDVIVIERLSASDNFGIDKITEVINEIYDSGIIPENFI